MTHEKKLGRWLSRDAGLVGCEIGAGGKPLPGLVPPAIQVDCFKAFGDDTCTADLYGHACALPFQDHALDYVLASHVLEHVANPVAALQEWYRVVRPGGIIYFIVPNRRATWDRARELTPVAHLLKDFCAGTSASDATHIEEFAEQVAPEYFGGNLSAKQLEQRREDLAAGLRQSAERGDDINIHFHTFEPSNLRDLLETLAAPIPCEGPTHPRLLWEILEIVDAFPAATPNGVLAVLRVTKGWRALADAEVLRLRARGKVKALFRDNAQPFADWAQRTPGLGGVR